MLILIFMKRIESAKARVRRRHVLNVAVSLLLLYVVVPQIGYFKKSFHVLRTVHMADLWLAVLLTAITYVMASGLYQLLAKRPLHFTRTLWIRVASGFINRLLPGGIGGISLSVQYLRSSGHSLVEASTVVGTNNTVGFLGHLLLIIGLSIATDANIRRLHLPHFAPVVYLIASTVILAGVIVIVCIARVRKLIASTAYDVVRNMISYRRNPERLIGAMLLSMLLTATYATVLYICCRAVDAQVSFFEAFIVFTLGMLTGIVTPTPGGLIGMETGLVAGFVADGVTAADALAAALIFRFLTYWLPILPGVIAFRVAEKRRYI